MTTTTKPELRHVEQLSEGTLYRVVQLNGDGTVKSIDSTPRTAADAVDWIKARNGWRDVTGGRFVAQAILTEAYGPLLALPLPPLDDPDAKEAEAQAAKGPRPLVTGDRVTLWTRIWHPELDDCPPAQSVVASEDDLPQERWRCGEPGQFVATFDGTGFRAATVTWRTDLHGIPAHPLALPQTILGGTAEGVYHADEFDSRDEALQYAADANQAALAAAQWRFDWEVVCEVGSHDRRHSTHLHLNGNVVGYEELSIIRPVRIIAPTPEEIERFAGAPVATC